MSKGECERVGSCSLSVCTHFMPFFMDVEVGRCPDVVCPPPPFPKAPFYIQSLTSSQEITFTAVTHLTTLFPPSSFFVVVAPLFIFHAILLASVETLSPSVFNLMAV